MTSPIMEGYRLGGVIQLFAMGASPAFRKSALREEQTFPQDSWNNEGTAVNTCNTANQIIYMMTYSTVSIFSEETFSATNI